MNALEILIAGIAGGAAIVVATVTTFYALLRQDREKRDRALFHAYVHSPVELDAWLAEGAREHIQRTLILENLRRT